MTGTVGRSITDLNGVMGHWVAESVSHGSMMKWHEDFTTH